MLEGNATTTLTARLVGPDGAPLADLAIVALAPDAGSSGVFADPTPEGTHIARALTDAEGNEYLDFFGGILTTMTGYNVPSVVAAIQDQAQR